MELMDQICKTAEFQDGTIRTQSAEEDQENRKRETALIDQELLLNLMVSATELTDQACKTAEFQGGTIKTQFAEEDQEKRKRETASIDQELLCKLIHLPDSQPATQCMIQIIHAFHQVPKNLLLNWRTIHPHFLSATQCMTQIIHAELESNLHLLKDHLHSHNATHSTTQTIHAEPELNQALLRLKLIQPHHSPNATHSTTQTIHAELVSRRLLLKEMTSHLVLLSATQ